MHFKKSKLFPALDQLSSEAGVQHGDPLGPSLLWPFTKYYLPLMQMMNVLIYFSKHGSWMMGYWLVRRHQYCRRCQS